MVSARKSPFVVDSGAEISAGGCAPPLTVQGLLQRFYPDFAQGRHLDEHVHRVLWRLRYCRTARLGGYRYDCRTCGYSARLYQSCRDRHCSVCQGKKRHAWAERVGAALLPTPHFQVVFTLPAELRAICQAYPRETYDALFRASSETVLALAKTRWKATPSILSVLHTWSRALTYHPHVHLVVSAGGLRDDGTWHAANPKFMFDVRAMRRLFRGKFLHALKKLDLPLSPAQRVQLGDARDRAHAKRWVVHVETPEGRGADTLVRYLARYVNQMAISDHRLVACDGETVTFRTRGSETVTLAGVEFVRRLAQHVLPKGFKRSRPSGLLATPNRARLAQARALLGGAPVALSVDDDEDELPEDVVVLLSLLRGDCPCCRQRLQISGLPPDYRLRLRGPP